MPTPSPVPFSISTLQPGAYSAVNASALQAAQQGQGQPIVAVMGATLGGIHNVYNLFRGVGAMRALTRGGVAYDVARFVFSAAAPQVAVVRVGASTPSTLVLAGTGNCVTLNSIDEGSWTTRIKIEVQASNKVIIRYVDDLGITYTETYAGLSTVANIVAAINGTLYGYPKSAYVTAVAGVGTLPLAVIAQTPLAGGTDPAPIAGDWTAALVALESQEVDIIVPATGDSTIHAQVLAHCQAMSQPSARKERVVVAGGLPSESVSTYLARMSTLRDKRIQLVYPDMIEFDATGVQQSFAPFYLAGKIAGMHAALPDTATALTHERVPVLDMAVRLSTIPGGDVDTLLAAGVTPIAPAPVSGFWLSDSLSGYNQDDVFRDFHKCRSADSVSKRLRFQLENQFVGSKALDGSAADIKVVAQGVLQNLKDETLIRNYQPVTVTRGVNASTYIVSAPIMLVDTTKFILIEVLLQPSSTLNLGATVNSADVTA